MANDLVPSKRHRWLPGHKNVHEPHYSIDDMKKALFEARGSISGAARYLDCVRATVQNYMKRYPELVDFVDEVDKVHLDDVDTSVRKRAEDGDQRAQEFILARRHPLYRNKTEVTGKDGGPIEVMSTVDDRAATDLLFEVIDVQKLTRSECVELSLIAEEVDKHGSLDGLTVEQFTRLKELKEKAKPDSAKQSGDG